MKELFEITQKALAFEKEAHELFGTNILKNKSSNKISNFDIAVITASLDEFDSIKGLLSEFSEIKTTNDNHMFYSGKLKGKSGLLNVVLPVPISMGIEACVSVTTKTLTYYNPKYIFMVGICAGNKKVTKIGDIIIAEKALNYNQIVEIEKKDASTVKKFMQNADSINTKLKTKLKLFSRSKIISEIKKSYRDSEIIISPLYCKVGLMVTGSSLIRSESKINEINESYLNVLGLDMETHGFYFTSCNTFDNKQPYFVSIKSVSDFGDNTNHKLNANQRKEYALYSSSQAFLKFIETEL
jgi:nucleoside phosphorylase